MDSRRHEPSPITNNADCATACKHAHVACRPWFLQTKMKQLFITLLLIFMSVLSSFGQTGSQKPYNDLADLDEVTLTDSMIAMRTLPKAEQLLQAAGYELQMSAYEWRDYCKMGGGQATIFSMRKAINSGNRLAMISFITLTPSRILRQKLLELGYEQLSVDEQEVTYRKDNISVLMTGYRALPSFSVTFKIKLDNKPQKKP